MEQVLLEINHIQKAFGGHKIIDDFSLTVQKGEVVVIIGPSGCGKSTLLRCVNALEDIQGGEILLNGEPIRREAKNISLMRQKIGMVFQSYDLFPHKTILENILLAPLKVQKRREDDFQHLMHHLRVQCCGNLIQQQDLRMHDQCADDRDALLLSPGKLTRISVLPICKANPCQEPHGLLFRFRAVSFLYLQWR